MRNDNQRILARCDMIISWFSGGITSAIACKWAIDNLSNVHLVYIETGSHHPDHMRFLKDCENWYGRSIEIIKSNKYQDVFDVIDKTRFINSPYGAACTRLLKKDVRKLYEKDKQIEGQVWGFDYSKREILRAERHQNNHIEMKCFFPLIDLKITKQQAINQLIRNNIAVPSMYKLGYLNSNCIGCVKGGAAYWNKIRIDFPEIFAGMSHREREINKSCLKNYYLDELPINAGRGKPPLVLDCGSVGEGCEIELMKSYMEINE